MLFAVKSANKYLVSTEKGHSSLANVAETVAQLIALQEADLREFTEINPTDASFWPGFNELVRMSLEEPNGPCQEKSP